MALPFARSKLVRYLTSKVIENVTREITQAATSQQLPAAPESDSTMAANPDLHRLVESINAAFAQTYEQIEALEARIDLAERRMARFERRWGWRMIVKIVVAVVIAFVLGLVAWQLYLLITVPR